jgi:acyl-CoA thioester hydrolase
VPYSSAFRTSFEASPDDIDENGHVNNVVYVQWMQEAAIRHSRSVGATAAVMAAGATWVVRSHRVEYLLPVRESELVHVETWIEDVQRVKSTRRYRFVRDSDDREVAHGETLWVCIDVETGRPRAVPADVMDRFRE